MARLYTQRKGYTEFLVCLNMAQYVLMPLNMPEYGWILLNVSEYT